MKAQSFESQLRNAVPPAVDPAVRLRARRAALLEFERVQAGRAQTSDSAPKLAPRTNRNSRNVVFGGIATASVAVVAVSVVLLLPSHEREVSLRVPATPVNEPQPQAPADTTTAVEQSAAQTPPAVETTVPVETQRRSLGSRLTAAKKDERPTQPRDEQPAPAVAEPSDALEAPVEEVTVAGTPIRVQVQSSPSPVTAISGADDLGSVSITGSRVESKRGLLSSLFRSAPTRDRQIAELQEEGRDKFEHFETNSVKRVADDPVSTFSVDVDTASYSFVRRQLNGGELPQQDAVRVEEMINYFDYAWPAPESREQPFGSTVTVTDSPWGKGKKLIHIGIKGYELPVTRKPDVNLVLLMDVSGSMDQPDKLPLARESVALLLESLKPTDTLAIVVYAGAAGEVLPPTPVRERGRILEALQSLRAGGSTAGAEGIRLAYRLAEKSFRKEGVNRILLATDGDFNVGITDHEQLKGFVAREREKGIHLSVLGFGQGNYRDEMAQALAQNGNGVAAYIDTLNEAKKVLVQEATSSLFPIAKDVKLQVEFNPATVAEYRLVGYETRALNREDFNNDKVDAGDVGSGHTVTAIYEITPTGSEATLMDESRYAARESRAVRSGGKADEYGFLKIRYKLPNGVRSRLVEQPIRVDAGVPAALRKDVAFSTAVAGFAQILRGSRYTGDLSLDDVLEQAEGALGDDPHGYRAEFLDLVKKAKSP